MLEDAAYGSLVPYTKGYRELTDEQKQVVRSDFPLLQDDEDPPYPLHGPQAIIRAMTQMPQSIARAGVTYLNVKIGADGTPLEVTIVRAPTPEVGNSAGSVLLLSKFTPARCAGKPCAMIYPYRLRFDVDVP